MLRLEPENILLGAVADSKEQAIRQAAGLFARSGTRNPELFEERDR